VIDRLKRAIDFAIAKEKEAEAFYKEWAERATQPAVKALFSEFAGMECEHARKLAQVSPEDLLAQGDAPPDLHISDYLVDVEATPNVTLQDAMILAMKREEAAVSLYEQLAQLTPAARALFGALAEEERRHKRLLESEYDDFILTED